MTGYFGKKWPPEENRKELKQMISCFIIMINKNQDCFNRQLAAKTFISGLDCRYLSITDCQMEETMPDRRIERTQSTIFRTFMYLLLEKEVKEITVKELCEKADINKSTFYLHFRDIYDCYGKCMQRINHIILETAQLYTYQTLFENPAAYLSRIFDFLEQDLLFYQQLASSPHFPSLMATFKEWLIHTELELYGIAPETDWEGYTTIVFLIEGITGLIFRSISFYNREKLTKQLASFVLNCRPSSFFEKN